YYGAQSNHVSLTVKPKSGGPPPESSLAISARTGARNGAMLAVSITVSNSGTVLASGITLNRIGVTTLAGAGQAGLLAPALPVIIGNLRPAASTVVNLELEVPITVEKLSLTENGTFEDQGGKVHQFSSGQVLVLDTGTE
ncbi:MAG: hypothetical protein JO319_19340, partial [Acidobacteriaceae bacterium]|nr:hypothetical protein [Acidobacteriaceae bacterium]